METEKLIELIQERTADKLVKALIKNKMLKTKEDTCFKKTEKLLFNYPRFKEVLKSKYDELEYIQNHGILKKSTSFVNVNTGLSKGQVNISNEYEKALNQIEKLQSSIYDIERYIKKIDLALLSIKDDPYYQIIPMKYFEGMTWEDIAIELYCDTKTAQRNKNRLVNIIQIRLFSDEYLEELLY